MTIPPIVETVEVPLDMDRAFALFVDDLSSWWPYEYTWSRELLEWIGIEPKMGGHCYELGPDGFRLDWGRVVEYHPPTALALLWQIEADRVPEPNPERASRVDVSFEAVGPASHATRVTLTHSRFENHGGGAQEYREAMASVNGWRYILERFASASS